MQRMFLNVQAGQVSAELFRHGLAAATRVHVLVEVAEAGHDALPMTTIAQAGGALDLLAEEPNLYTDADLLQQAR